MVLPTIPPDEIQSSLQNISPISLLLSLSINVNQVISMMANHPTKLFRLLTFVNDWDSYCEHYECVALPLSYAGL